MYQFSLSSYVELFNTSIIRSRKVRDKFSGQSDETLSGSARNKSIIEYHSYALYCYACVGLFERHKLLLSLQICFSILLEKRALTRRELMFLLQPQRLVGADQVRNAANEFVSQEQWEAILYLGASIGGFEDLVSCFEATPLEWKVLLYQNYIS